MVTLTGRHMCLLLPFQLSHTKLAVSLRAVPLTAVACCTSGIVSQQSMDAPSSSSLTMTSSSLSRKPAMSSPSLWFPRMVNISEDGAFIRVVSGSVQFKVALYWDISFAAR